MAGDWIKVENVLPEKPEVDVMASHLGIDPDAVVGKLIRTWAWADQHSVNGHAVSVTAASIDRRTHCPGFAEALRKVGWLEGRDGSLSFPRFDRHNGQTSKSRALAADRQRARRDGTCHDESVTEALPEKRREDIVEREKSAGAKVSNSRGSHAPRRNTASAG
jgi:DNA replication protein DnaT